MLKNKIFYACCGYGDLFLRLPLIEEYGNNCCLLAPHWYNGKGIPRLVKTLVPNARLRYTPDIFRRRRQSYYHQPFSGLSTAERESQQLNLKLRTTLSTEAIDRIEQLTGMGDYLVVHPCPSGEERMWQYWKQVEFPMPIKVVGGNEDPKILDGEYYAKDFFWTAQLIRGSKGVICANSAIMQLGNILDAKILCIYTQKDESKLWECNGIKLTNPAPGLVSRIINSKFLNSAE